MPNIIQTLNKYVLPISITFTLTVALMMAICVALARPHFDGPVITGVKTSFWNCASPYDDCVEVKAIDGVIVLPVSDSGAQADTDGD